MSNDAVRILVIDDEEIIHVSLRKMLERRGYVLTSAMLAVEGLGLLEQKDPFDLIITDLMMPQMDGIQLLGHLKAQGNTTPIVMITGYPTVRTAILALRLGAVDYIVKPFTRSELIGALGRALRIEVEDHAGPNGAVNSLSPGSLVPGAVIFLPNHAWAQLEWEGTFKIGIERTFIQAIKEIRALKVNEVLSEVEQGQVGIRLVCCRGEEHGVTMPLSGQILEVNEEAIGDLSGLGHDIWLLRIRASDLDDELQALVHRMPSAGGGIN